MQVDSALDDVVKMDTGAGGGGGGGGRGRGRGGVMRGRGGPMRGRGGFRGGMMGMMRAVPYGGGRGAVCDNCFQPGCAVPRSLVSLHAPVLTMRLLQPDACTAFRSAPVPRPCFERALFLLPSLMLCPSLLALASRAPMPSSPCPKF